MKRGAPGRGGSQPAARSCAALLLVLPHTVQLRRTLVRALCAARYLSSSFAQWLRACRGAESCWRKTLWNQFRTPRLAALHQCQGEEETVTRKGKKEEGTEGKRDWPGLLEERNRCNGRRLLWCSESGGRGKCEGGSSL